MKIANPEIRRLCGLRNMLALSLLLLLSPMSSCRKEPEPEDAVKPGEKVEASGVVVDAFSGNPIPYAEMSLTKNNTGMGWGAKMEDAKLSDSAGRFAFFFHPEEGYLYDLYVSKLHYVSGFNDAVNPAKHNRNMRVALKPYGYVIYHIPKPVESYSSIHVQGANTRLTAPYNDTTLFGFTIGNKIEPIWIRVYYPSGQWRDMRDSIYVPALDTVDYHVKF